MIDDFEDQDLSEFFVFAGGAEPVLTINDTGADGTAASLQVDIDPATYGGFAGFGRDLPGAPVDASGVADPYLVFSATVDGTATLEINHQAAGGAANGEIRNALRFVERDLAGFTEYALPLASFFQTEAPLDVSAIQNVVFAVIDAVAGGTTDANQVNLLVDQIRLVDGISFNSSISALDFDDGDFADTNDYFYFQGGEGISATASTDTPDGSANAFSGSIDGDDFGGFAGFGRTLPGGPLDASSGTSFNFFYRANGPAVLEINLQSGAAVGGSENRETLRLSDTGGDYRAVSLPLEAFIQTTAAPADISDIFNVVFTFLQVPGDGDAGTSEFEFAIDGVGVGAPSLPTSQELPPALAKAPSVFPNPTAGAATVAFDLEVASAVSIDVIDLLGRRVLEVADGVRAAGPVRLAVATDDLPAGVYVVRVQTDGGMASTRLTVVR
ncbi:T9SS type A sorting domain-containing protein [Rubrivirga sp.]|uniref:T9SS type A sorting domain-containing protein n=1 Tax=Rubrivirga sp. TaxID=1885344 RepID=UPI003C791A39